MHLDLSTSLHDGLHDQKTQKRLAENLEVNIPFSWWKINCRTFPIAFENFNTQTTIVGNIHGAFSWLFENSSYEQLWSLCKIRSDAARSISPYTRKNSVYGYFSRSDFQRLLNSCTNHRSSHPEVFCKNGVPKNFAKFTGKHLCQSPESQSPATVLKKSL